MILIMLMIMLMILIDGLSSTISIFRLIKKHKFKQIK